MQIMTGPEAKQQSVKTRGSVCYGGRGDQRIEQGVWKPSGVNGTLLTLQRLQLLKQLSN